MTDFPNNESKLFHRTVLSDTMIDHEIVDRGNGDESFQLGCIYTIKHRRISFIDDVKAS